MANKKWLQRANKSMKRRGTVGAFTQYCGGKVTESCIEKGLNSNNPTIVKQAQFAKNVRNMQPGGYLDANGQPMQAAQPMQPMQSMQAQQPVPQMPSAQPAVSPLATEAPQPELQTGAPSAGPGAEALPESGEGQGGGGGGAVAADVAGQAGAAISANAKGEGGKTAGGALSGAAKGASMGATLGTIVPGLGNVIGGAIGAVVGGIGGALKGKKQARQAREQKLAAQQAKEQQMLANIQGDQPMAKYGSFTRFYGGGMKYMQEGGTSRTEHLLGVLNAADSRLGNTEARTANAAHSSYIDSRLRRMMPDPMERAMAKADLMKSRAKGQSVKSQADAISRMRAGGAKNLPGGVQMPIGFGVDKFSGNKHDESGNGSDSGIILEEGGKSKPGIEVEDGELQTDVKTTDGKKEYIVSDYIVNPATGNTLAEDMEREIKKSKSQKQADAIKQKYVKLNEQLKEDGNPERVKAQSGEYKGGALSAEEAKIGEQSGKGKGFFGEATGKGLEAMKARNPWYDFDKEGFDPEDPESVKKFQKEFNKRAPEGQKIEEDGKYGTQTESVKLAPQMQKRQSPGAIPQIQMDRPTPELQVAPKQPETPAPAEEPEATPEPEQKGAKFRPRFTGTTLQALGPIMGLRQHESAKLMKPEYIDKPQLRRVDLDYERDKAAASQEGMRQMAQSSMAGPAGFAAAAAAQAQGAKSQAEISRREGRENTAISDREKQLGLAVDRSNQAASMQASKYNAGARERAQARNVARRTAAFDKLGTVGTQTVKDYNQQYANFGSDIMEYGAPAADYYANVYKGNVPLVGSRNISVPGMTSEEAAAAFDQPQETTNATSKKGGYIKRAGKIKRRKRR